MSPLPVELVLRILQVRTHIIWKKGWLKNIAVVNEEYNHDWVWKGWCLQNTPEGFVTHPFRTYNYRYLQIPQIYLFNIFSEKMYIHRYKSSTIFTPTRANFPRMHYFYSLRPEFECKDWFVRFLESKKISQ